MLLRKQIETDIKKMMQSQSAPPSKQQAKHELPAFIEKRSQFLTQNEETIRNVLKQKEEHSKKEENTRQARVAAI